MTQRVREKECFGCKKALPRAAFSVHRTHWSGLQHRCKECVSEYHTEYAKTPKNKIAVKMRMRRYRSTEIGKKKTKLAYKKSRWRIYSAVAQLKKEPCEICGCGGAHAHHEDYSKPLDVRWLCQAHHRAVHRKYKPLKLEARTNAS